MAVAEYGGTIIEALSTDVLPEKPNGWFLKLLDTGETFIRRNGTWAFLNLGMSSFTKTTTKSGRVTTKADGTTQVLFNTPFLDNEYSIALSCTDVGRSAKLPFAYKYDRRPTGFGIITRRLNGQPVGGIEVSWLCTRDYNP